MTEKVSRANEDGKIMLTKKWATMKKVHLRIWWVKGELREVVIIVVIIGGGTLDYRQALQSTKLNLDLVDVSRPTLWSNFNKLYPLRIPRNSMRKTPTLFMMKLNYHLSKASPFWNGSSPNFRKFIIFQADFQGSTK